MQALFLKVLEISLTGSLFAIAVILVRLLFRKAPRWIFCVLWGLVALRLMMPVSIESNLSVVPKSVASGQVISNIGESYVGNVDVYYENNAGYANALEAGRQPVYSNDGYYVVTDQGTLEAPATISDTVFPILAWIWVAGMVAMLTYLLLSFHLIKRSMAEATLLRDNIWQCEQVDSPFVLGIIKPRIYLPYAITDADMTNVLAHEQAHLQRRDHWWKPLGFLLLSVHWFNPLMWIAYVLLCRDIEAACDEKVIQNMEKDQMRAYSTALLHCSVHRSRIAACPLAFGEIGAKERIRRVMGYKKPAFWIIIAAAALCIVIAVCFLTDPIIGNFGVLPHIHSHGYVVEEVTYESGMYSFSVTAGENSPIYSISEDMQLCSQMEHSEEGTWTQLGKLEETQLTKENFDNLLRTEGWVNGQSAKRIRRNTEHVWQVIYNQDTLYYVLQQKNGDLYLAFGYYDYSEKNDPYSDDTSIRWLYKLAIDANGSSGMVATSGENTVPMISFPKGTAIADYADAIYWLQIDPDPDASVPFSVWQDGEEMLGYYNAFDSETFEPIEHLVPSGLEPQTYLFQNADPSKSYIVVAAFSTEADAPVYAFGAVFKRPADSDATAREVKLVETVSDVNESFYSVSANLPATDLSHPGQILADMIADEWNTYDALTQQQRMLSSHLWGTVSMETDTWAESENVTGITVSNPLESMEWINKTGYPGMESADPSMPVKHVKVNAYAMQEMDRNLIKITIIAGYNMEDIRITLTATVMADSGPLTTGVASHGYATFEEAEAMTGSGLPVLIVTTDEANNTGYYHADFFDPVAYWVKDHVFYTLRVFGDASDQEKIQDTLYRILEEI